MKDFKILGAGLSGLCASINLIKNGYDVQVFEKRNDCGERFSSDLEGLENWSSNIDVFSELKQMNIKINFDFAPYKKMYMTNGKEKIEIKSKKPIFYLVNRGTDDRSLDQGLKNQAVDLGVDIHFNSKQSKKNIDIVATGPIRDIITVMAKGIILKSESPDIAVALVNNQTSFKGYSYLLINRGYGCICTVCFRKFDNMDIYLKNSLEQLTKLFDINIKKIRNFAGYGSFNSKLKLTEYNQLNVGEASGLQDCLWGFGMRYALNSGFFAAKSITEKIDYKKLINNNLLDRFKAGIINRYYVEKLKDYGNYLIYKGENMKGDEHINFLRNIYNLSLRDKIVYPFANRLFVKKYLSKT